MTETVEVSGSIFTKWDVPLYKYGAFAISPEHETRILPGAFTDNTQPFYITRLTLTTELSPTDVIGRGCVREEKPYGYAYLDEASYEHMSSLSTTSSGFLTMATLIHEWEGQDILRGTIKTLFWSFERDFRGIV